MVKAVRGNQEYYDFPINCPRANTGERASRRPKAKRTRNPHSFGMSYKVCVFLQSSAGRISTEHRSDRHNNNTHTTHRLQGQQKTTMTLPSFPTQRPAQQPTVTLTLKRKFSHAIKNPAQSEIWTLWWRGSKVLVPPAK